MGGWREIRWEVYNDQLHWWRAQLYIAVNQIAAPSRRREDLQQYEGPWPQRVYLAMGSQEFTGGWFSPLVR